MEYSAPLAAIRFGTGLSPRHAPPESPAALLAGLAGPDLPRDRLSAVRWEVAASDALRLGQMRRASVQSRNEADKEAVRLLDRALTERWFQDLARLLHRLAHGTDGLRERLALFWADHFSVSGQAGFLRSSLFAYEADLRAGITGRFADLLILAVTHPAMVTYLDQNRSIGPNSIGGRRRGGGLNENLAREVLELHTLGAGAPYTQEDVTQLAELMTGLTMNRDGLPQFHVAWAEPGPETLLGRTYGAGPPDVAHLHAALRDLSVHPATAAHVSRKLAVHFVSDTPDPELVGAMTRVWLDTGGDLLRVYETLLTHPAAWAPARTKVRRPIEMIGAALRALDLPFAPERLTRREVRRFAVVPLRQMGQDWHRAPGPDGWPEAADAWITPQLLAARIGWAMSAPEAMGALPDPRALLDTALGSFATPRTRFAAGAAETRAAGIGLVLSAPEFQRR